MPWAPLTPSLSLCVDFLSFWNCRVPSSANPRGRQACTATALVRCPQGSPQPLCLRKAARPALGGMLSERPASLCSAVTVMCKLSVSATGAGTSRLIIRSWDTQRARRYSPNARAYWTLTSVFPLPLLRGLDAGEHGMGCPFHATPASAPGRLSASLPKALVLQGGLRVKCSTNVSHHQNESFHQPVR